MNWVGWLWGSIVSLIGGSIVAVNTMSQFPNATPFQLGMIIYPAVAGAFLTFLMKSPFPGSAGVNGGKPPEVVKP